MDIYVLGSTFNRIGICDNYKSLIWTTRYYEAGDFEIYAPATQENVDTLFKLDYYVVREKDIGFDGSSITCKNVMVIEKVEITTDVENGDYIIVSGRDLKSILARRVIYQQTTLSGKFETALLRVITSNIISPSLAQRKIANFKLAQKKGFTEKIEKQVTGANLYDFVVEMCKSYEIGWDVYVIGRYMYFELYKGKNLSRSRSESEADSPLVVFSSEFDDIISSDYYYDKKQFKNFAFVAGEGEGLDRTVINLYEKFSSGIARREIYIDARNVSSNNGEISNDEYNKMLQEEGLDALNDTANSVTQSFEGQIDVYSNFKFGEDYNLGDVVEISTYRNSTTARIVQVIESEDENGSTVIPSFETKA